jgi:hypothetical protein
MPSSRVIFYGDATLIRRPITKNEKQEDIHAIDTEPTHQAVSILHVQGVRRKELRLLTQIEIVILSARTAKPGRVV